MLREINISWIPSPPVVFPTDYSKVMVLLMFFFFLLWPYGCSLLMFLMDLSSIVITSLRKKEMVTLHFFGLLHVYCYGLFGIFVGVIGRRSLRKHAFSNILEI